MYICYNYVYFLWSFIKNIFTLPIKRKKKSAAFLGVCVLFSSTPLQWCWSSVFVSTLVEYKGSCFVPRGIQKSPWGLSDLFSPEAQIQPIFQNYPSDALSGQITLYRSPAHLACYLSPSIVHTMFSPSGTLCGPHMLMCCVLRAGNLLTSLGPFLICTEDFDYIVSLVQELVR